MSRLNKRRRNWRPTPEPEHVTSPGPDTAPAVAAQVRTAPERQALADQLAARLGLDRPAQLEPLPAPVPAVPMVALLDGRTVPRSLVMTLTEYLPAYPDPTACWVCGVATPPADADYTLFEEHNDLGRGRTCPACVTEASLIRPSQTAARYRALLGHDIPEPAGTGWWVRITSAVELLFPSVSRLHMWSPYAPGTPQRWAHVDAEHVHQAAAVVCARRDAINQPRPHPAGLPCGVCGILEAITWASHTLGVAAHTFGMCGTCEGLAEGRDLARRMDRAVSELAGLVAVQQGAASLFGLDPYAYAITAPSWPHGTAEPWAYLPPNLPARIRARWPSRAPVAA